MAVIFQWSGDGLAPGTLSTTSAGTGDTAPTQINLTNATADIITTPARTPAIRLREAAVGSTAWLDWNFEPSPTVSMRAYFTPTTALATTHAIFSLRGAAEARLADIILTSAGAVRVYDIDNAFQTVGASGTIAVGNTYRFEITLNVESSTLNIAIYHEHATTPFVIQNNVPGNFTTANVEAFRIGKNTTTQQAETQLWDDILLTTSQSFIGPAVVIASVSAGPNQTQIEPFSTVALEANIVSGTVSSWSWTQLSGSAVTLSGSGPTRTFVAPASPETQVLEFQVTGDGTTSSVTTVSVNPHLEWMKTNSDIVALRPGDSIE